MDDVFETVYNNTELKFEKLGTFSATSSLCVGELMQLVDFVELVNTHCIMEDDGVIDEVLVDGELTNIRVVGWSIYFEVHDHMFDMTLQHLLLLDTAVDVAVVWYNN